MTNAIVWELSPINTSEGKKFLISYIRQVHYIHGFNDIYVPDRVFTSINSMFESYDTFIKRLPSMGKTNENILKNFEKGINHFLWSTKRTDILETGLTAFLATLAIWLQAKKLKATIILPLSKPISNFSRLIHILVGEQREAIECLIDDIEYWFFSHFADFSVEWPYFFDFSSVTIDMLQKDKKFMKCRNNFVESREKIFEVSFKKATLTQFTRTFLSVTNNQKAFFNHLYKKYRKFFITTKASVAPSNQSWKTLKRVTSKWESIGISFEDAGLCKYKFAPYFTRLDLYPLELFKKIKANSLSETTTSFRSAFNFGTALKAEMKLALDNYRKRIELR
jgi:hypothetical protein